MKVIDLLNKIANGEEVPKKVFYKTGGEYPGGYYWNYDESRRDYKDKVGDYVFNAGNYHVIDMLNREIEIIEEDKKIEKLKQRTDTGLFGSMVNDEIKVAEAINKQANYLSDIVSKINEIIDYLEKDK